MTDAVSWLHPIGGTLAAALLVWVGLQGIRARHKARYAPEARKRHSRFALWVYGYVLIVAAAGMTSVVLLRPDLQLASSLHFWTMWAMITAMTSGFVTSRLFAEEPTLRSTHRWLGIGSMVLVLVGAALGFGLLPG